MSKTNPLVKKEEEKKKYIQLALDPKTFRKLKKKKEEFGYKTWEDFILINLLGVSKDELKERKINETVYECFVEIEGFVDDNYKYYLELLRVAIIKLALKEDIKEVRKILKMLDEELKKEEEE